MLINTDNTKSLKCFVFENHGNTKSLTCFVFENHGNTKSLTFNTSWQHKKSNTYLFAKPKRLTRCVHN